MRHSTDPNVSRWRAHERRLLAYKTARLHAELDAAMWLAIDMDDMRDALASELGKDARLQEAESGRWIAESQNA